MRSGKSKIFDGSGYSIGDRGGARPTELREVYKHLGGAWIGKKDGDLHGHGLIGRIRSVFSSETRENLQTYYPEGSIIVKRNNVLAAVCRQVTGWPGDESGRLSGSQLVRRNQIKAGSAAVALVWGAFSYEATPVIPSIVPSPTEALSALAKTPDKIDEWRASRSNGGTSTATTTPTSAPPASPETTSPSGTAGSAPSVAPTTLPPFGTTGEQPSAETTLAPLPTAPEAGPVVSATPTGAFTFGEMSCAATVQVTIGEGEFPFNALARVTGEPLHDLPNGEAFWEAIVDGLNGGSVNTGTGDTFTGPDECSNYQTINNGFIG